MQTSETIKEIATALAKAQAAMHGATKDGKNPAFKSTYATLSNVIEAARGPLTENGIAFIQSPGAMEEGGITITTSLVHSSGEWFKSTITMPVRDRNNPQAVGGAITYACRYSLMAMLGLPPVDDDGNAAAQGGPRPSNGGNHAPRQPAPPVEFSSGRKHEPGTIAKTMIGALKIAKTVEDLSDWGEAEADAIHRLSPEDAEAVRAAFRDHKKALGGAAREAAE
jgi:hypothetical protein